MIADLLWCFYVVVGFWCVCRHVCAYRHMHAHPYIRTHTVTLTYIHTYTLSHSHTDIHTLSYSDTHTCMHTITHTHSVTSLPLGYFQKSIHQNSSNVIYQFEPDNTLNQTATHSIDCRMHQSILPLTTFNLYYTSSAEHMGDVTQTLYQTVTHSNNLAGATVLSTQG